MHAVAGGAGQRATGGARRLQQPLVLVCGQPWRSIIPEPRRERLAIAAERGVAPERRRVQAQIVSRHEGIAVGVHGSDIVADALAVTAAAHISGPTWRKTGGVDDGGIGPPDRRTV